LAGIYDKLSAFQAEMSADAAYGREDKKPALADVAACSGAGGAKYTEYYSEGACADQPQLTATSLTGGAGTTTVLTDVADTTAAAVVDNSADEEKVVDVITGYVSDVQCTRKRTASKEFRAPDNGIDPLADLVDHTVFCLYEIESCRNSGYDILADVGIADEDGTLLYYAKYRLDAGLNSQMEALLKSTATTKGFRAKVTGATAAPSSDINGRAGFVLSGGTVEEAADSGLPAGSFAAFYESEDGVQTKHALVAGLAIGLTLVLGIPLAVCMLRAQDAAASSVPTEPSVQPSNRASENALYEGSGIAENNV